MYSIIGIDGIDGAGKGTASKFIKERLMMMGYHVITFDPPFYETPSGHIVTDYLTKGYGDIRDRTIASMIYSFDRNMWMRDHFTESFINPENWDEFSSDDKLIILYNRNWLSNVIFQTSIDAQADEDTAHLMGHVYGIVKDNDGKEIQLTMPTMHQIVNDIKVHGYPSNTCNIRNYRIIRTIQKLYREMRAVMVKNMMRDVYMMEITPWHARLPRETIEERFPMSLPYFNEFDFIDAADAVCNIVLCPHISKTSVDILHGNMMKRYEGNESKMDRNEKSSAFLDSVMENIHWINANMVRILHSPSTRATACIPYAGIKQEFDPFSDSIYLIKKAYSYEILHTTDKVSGARKSIETVTNEVMALLHQRIPNFGIQK